MNHLFEEFKKEVERIEFPEARLEKAIQKAINDGKPKRSVGKKIAFLSSAAALFICLLFGSAFVSPTMAATLAKIPVIGSVFELGDPGENIRDELRDKGYKIKDVFVSEPEKVVGVWVGGSEAYFADVKDDVKTIAENVLKSKHYDAFTVKVTDMRGVVSDMRDDGKDSPQMAPLDKMLIKLDDTLRNKDYKLGSAGVNYRSDSKTIEVQIQGSEVYYNNIKDDVRDTVNEVLQATNFQDYKTIKVTRRLEIEVKLENWGVVIMPAIRQELIGKKGYHVTSVSETLEDGTMQLNIKMSLESSDSSAKEIAEGIEENVTKILESKKFKPETGNLPYKVNVYSKDKKIIN